MDAVATSRPRAAVLTTDVSRQITKAYGGTFRFLKGLPSERDLNLLLVWDPDHDNPPSNSTSEGSDQEPNSSPEAAVVPSSPGAAPLSPPEEVSPRPTAASSVQAPSPNSRKVILKISNQADSFGLLGLQTEAMLHCRGAGCAVQEVFARRRTAKELRENEHIQSCVFDPWDYILLLKMSKKEKYFARLLSWVEGTVVGSTQFSDETFVNTPKTPPLTEEEEESSSARGRANRKEVVDKNPVTSTTTPSSQQVWAAAGRAMGKISRSLRQFTEKLEGFSEEFTLTSLEFEWNLHNVDTVIPKYLRYFDVRCGSISGGGANLAAPELPTAKKVKEKQSLIKELYEKFMRKYGAKYFGPAPTAEVELVIAHNDPNDNNLVWNWKPTALEDEGQEGDAGSPAAEGRRDKTARPEVEVSVLDFGDMVRRTRIHRGPGFFSERFPQNSHEQVLR